VIHVTLARPKKNFQTMDALWVSGTLKVQRSETGMGSAGYVMAAESLTPWKPH
jgi:hypothetical protein